jgi:hypothetical protein
MKALIGGVALCLGLFLMSGPSATAGERDGVLLTPAEGRAYRACLFEAWIQDYCAGNSWRPTSTADRVHATCIAANGGGRFPLEGRTSANTDDYCWAAAHNVEWRPR